MSRCDRCKIEIKDHAVACPLCHGVIKRENAKGQEKQTADADSLAVDNTQVTDFYPDVNPAMRKLVLILKIIIFLAIIAEGIMLVVNFNVNPDIKWSLITGVALFYGCFVLGVTLLHNRSLRNKILVQLLVGILAMIAIDFVLGYKGWSLSFGAPIAILAAELMVVVFMIVYHNRWQSYLFLQIALVLISLLFMILAFANVFKFKVLVFVAATVTSLILIGLILFGGRRAGDELKERFRI